MFKYRKSEVIKIARENNFIVNNNERSKSHFFIIANQISQSLKQKKCLSGWHNVFNMLYSYWLNGGKHNA